MSSNQLVQSTLPYQRVDKRPARFVTQTHAIGAPMAQPRSLLVAGLIAFALYLLGRRLSH